MNIIREFAGVSFIKRPEGFSSLVITKADKKRAIQGSVYKNGEEPYVGRYIAFSNENSVTVLPVSSTKIVAHETKQISIVSPIASNGVVSESVIYNIPVVKVSYE